MTIAPAFPDQPTSPSFSDGIGERVSVADAATGEPLQILRVRKTLTAVPSFEFALRERSARLANFRHAYYARVRRVDRVQLPAPGLAIVSDHVDGTRLSDILRVAGEQRLPLDINAALCVIRQLVPAVALLHENAREVAHGLIAPERLIVTPHARLVVVEHVLAAAIEQLQYSRERLWQEFRIAVPPSAGLPRFDHRTDVTGIGLVALALVLGRPITTEEFPHGLSDLIAGARERTALGQERRLSEPLRDWIARALQLDARRAFASAPAALTALEQILADDSVYVAAPVALETFLSHYGAELTERAVEQPPAPAPEAPVAQQAPAQVEHHGTSMSESPIDSRVPSSGQRVSNPEPPIPGAERRETNPESRETNPEPREPSHVPAPLPSGAIGSEVQPPMASGAPAPEAAPDSSPFATLDWATAGGPPPVVATARDISDLISAPDAPDAEPVAPPPAVPPPAFPFELPDAVPSTKGVRQSVSSPRRAPASRKALVAAAILLIAGSGGAVSWKYFRPDVAPPPAAGTLVVESNPAGVQIFVDGVEQGLTPARVSIPPGPHILELRGRGVPRVIPLNITAGAEIAHHVEFASTPETGALRVDSQLPGAKVIVDGVERGEAPLTIEDLLPGDHEVVLLTAAGSARQIVSIQAGGTASLVVPVPAPAPAAAGPVSGWLSVKAPLSLEVRLDGKVIGTTEVDRIMMAAGRHEIQIVNEPLGYQATRAVQVAPGKVTALAVDLPNGLVNLNATPWAEVWIDGERVGETPIGNLSVPIGAHEVVFRHPQLGEKRHAISVTVGTPVRLSVDMK